MKRYAFTLPGVDPVVRRRRMARARALRRNRDGLQLRLDFGASPSKEKARQVPGSND